MFPFAYVMGALIPDLVDVDWGGLGWILIDLWFCFVFLYTCD